VKKVLVISYYWPPAGGISLLRCLKFVKYLPHFGWEPVVYTAKDAQYPYYDHFNFKDIPEGITILSYPVIEPFNLFKMLSGRKKSDSLNNIVHVREEKTKWIDNLAIWIRGNFFIPDARSLWINPSVRFLSDYLEKNTIDAILTDGPPHTNTMIGYKLSKKFNIPFLADFQDPWTQADYYQLMKITPWAHKKHRKLEQQVFKQASKITIASRFWKRDLEKIGARDVDVIYWGYDEDDFEGLHQQRDQAFTIFHGGLLGYDRLPDGLFEALSSLVRETQNFEENLKIKLAGQVDFTVKEKLERLGLTRFTEFMGTVSRAVALQSALNAHILLLPLNKAENAKGRVPGKFFEYLRANRPILCLGPSEGDVPEIIEECKAGKTFDYGDINGIKNFVYEKFSLFLKGENNHQNINIEKYFVKNQVQKVSQYLYEIVG